MKCCKVCVHSDKTIIHRFGIDICEACKKFFVRNRATPLEKLPCRGAVQESNCQIDADVQRAPCPRCRLIKCLSLGMGNFSKQKKYSGKLGGSNGETKINGNPTKIARNNGSNTSNEESSDSNSSSSQATAVVSNGHKDDDAREEGNKRNWSEDTPPSLPNSGNSSSPSSSTAEPSCNEPPAKVTLVKSLVGYYNEQRLQRHQRLPLSPHCIPSISAEYYLRLSVESTAELSPLQTLQVDDSFLAALSPALHNEESEVWSTGMRAFEWAIQVLMNFFRCVPDMNKFPKQTQWFLIMRSLSSLTLAQTTLHFRDKTEFTPFYAFSPKLRDRWLALFPCYKNICKGTDCLAKVYNAQNLSFAEFSFVCALFVFRDDGDAESRQSQIVATRKAIFDSLQIYLHNLCGGNAEAIGAATRRLLEVVRILRAIQMDTFAAIMQMGVDKPHLQMNSSTWASIYEAEITQSSSSYHERRRRNLQQHPSDYGLGEYYYTTDDDSNAPPSSAACSSAAPAGLTNS